MMATGRPNAPGSQPAFGQRFPAGPGNRQSFGQTRPQGKTGQPFNLSSQLSPFPYYAAPPPPPRPPMPPQALKFWKPDLDVPEPPGTSDGRCTVAGSLAPAPHPGANLAPSIGSYPPLAPPPLPPLFPYMSPQLALSLQEGASQCGTSFANESSDLPFVPIIINDNDLKTMTETVKTQVEESKQRNNLLLYDDIIDPNLPKELREMFQPLYCKLCKLTLSSPVVARDHYKGKRHTRAIEVWVQNNPSKRVVNRNSGNGYNAVGCLQGMVTPQNQRPIMGVAPQQANAFDHPSLAQDYDRRNGALKNHHGFDRAPLPPPPARNFNHPNMKRSAGGNIIESESSNSNTEFIPAYRAALAGPGGPRKRLKKDDANGPNFDYCGLCKVSLTSAINAEQHYNGKNHKQRLIAQQEGGF